MGTNPRSSAFPYSSFLLFMLSLFFVAIFTMLCLCVLDVNSLDRLAIMGAEQSTEAPDKEAGRPIRKAKAKRKQAGEKKTLRKTQSRKLTQRTRTHREQDNEDTRKANEFIEKFLDPENEGEREVIQRALRLMIRKFREKKQARLQFEEDSRFCFSPF